MVTCMPRRVTVVQAGLPRIPGQRILYVIGIDPSESINILIRYKEEKGYPWPVATAPLGMLLAYRVIT